MKKAIAVLIVKRTKSNRMNHIYDIIKDERAANRSSTGLSRPVGNAMKNSPSKNSISQNKEEYKHSDKKIFGKNSKNRQKP